jgi:IclR family transcriptional regulator, acetate operon repressor
MPTKSKARPKPTATATDTPVARLFAVLELASKMGMISAADLVYLLDLPRPTAHRLISTLEGLDFLQKMPVKGKYAVAPKLVGLSTAILASTIVYAPIQTLLTAVAQRTGETCGLALMSMGEVEYIASVMGQSPLTLQFQAGQKAPLHCTSSGQVFLAHQEPELLSKFLATGPWEPLTEFTITDPKALADRLRKVRTQGYASNDSEYIFGVVGAAVAIRNKEGQVTAALTISAPRSRRSLEEIIGTVPTLKTYAERIGRGL